MLSCSAASSFFSCFLNVLLVFLRPSLADLNNISARPVFAQQLTPEADFRGGASLTQNSRQCRSSMAEANCEISLFFHIFNTKETMFEGGVPHHSIVLYFLLTFVAAKATFKKSIWSARQANWLHDIESCHWDGLKALTTFFFF